MLRATLLTAAHDERTREKVRFVVERSLIGATLDTDEADRQRRSGRIATQLIGMAMSCVRVEDRTRRVHERTGDPRRAVAPNIQRYIEGDLTGS